MPYDNLQQARDGRTTAQPAASSRAKQGTYFAPRLARSPMTEPELSANTLSKTVFSEVASTPVKPFLGSNVTPRSGSRRARIDSTSTTPNTTPTGTPSISQPNSIVPSGNAGNRTPGWSPRSNVHSPVSPSVARARGGIEIALRQSPGATALPSAAKLPENTSFFFFADDAVNHTKKSSADQADCTQKKAAFIHANGDEDDLSVHSIVIQSSIGCRPRSLAEGDGRATALKACQTSRPASVTAAKGKIDRETAFTPLMRSSRPPSPLKESSVPRNTMVKSAQSSRTTSWGSNHSQKQAKSVVETGTSSTLDQRRSRRSSIQSTTVGARRHSKALSACSIRSTSSKNGVVMQPATELTCQSSTTTKTGAREQTGDQAQTVHSIENMENVLSALPLSPAASLPNTPSPTAITPTSKAESLSSAVADARRERKVLDLEISNSSLLAINCTLEREIRKQTAELRRYRRLTSAGRISLNSSSGATSGAFSDVTSMTGSETLSAGSLSDLDGIGSLSEDEDDESDPEQPLSPASQMDHDARQRGRDERRLQLDLKKHRELLRDSQRMNQSLKLCLDWTEEMILEGRKALSYQVRINDVKVGGRVLAGDETAEDLDHGKCLLSPSHEISNPTWQVGTPPDGFVNGDIDKAGDAACTGE